MILIYHKGTQTFFEANDDVFIIDTNDLNAHQLTELEEGNHDVLIDVLETPAATPFWEAFDPFAEDENNPGHEPGTTILS